MKVIPFEKLDTETKQKLSTYKFPTKSKKVEKISKKALIKSLIDAMGWDWIIDVETTKKCKIKLSKRQSKRLNPNSYCVALTDDVRDAENLYVTIFNENFNVPTKYCKIKALTIDEILWLKKIF